MQVSLFFINMISFNIRWGILCIKLKIWSLASNIGYLKEENILSNKNQIYQNYSSIYKNIF
jgi:hypothetical protein